ncbi:putative mediator of RNA polymerase II transcription subunit 26 [Prunus avium]|uniref:Mediator of RNA polymerase II transcription subunit 26 n=1 Tax=Prunus avium TaxID=42229 RepID=A0A6P5SF96_PRUAV|nr:putative mediator of RNA polymerase II transcription subunit 26 [Prunus avium]
MSRCFPYPPPGYVKKGINDEALIESIKLQREDGKAKKEKKREKKREKKEKKARENGELENKKHGHKKRHKDERHQEDEKGRDYGKKRKHETENLDKSSLTEEHEHPVGSQNSSDSTVNSNKRQKQNSYPDGRHNSASIFRIRLPPQRHKDPEVLPREEQPCQLPIQKHKDPQVLPSQEQPSLLSLQRHKDPQVLPSQEQPSRLSLQRHKDPQVLPSQEQPSRLSLQRHKDPQVLPSQEQPSRLSLRKHKDPQVLPSQEQPSRLSLQRHKDPQVLPSREQPSRLSLQRHKDPQVLPSQEQPCSASGRTDNAFVQGMHEAAPRQGRDEGQHPCSTSGNSGKEVPVRLGKEKLRATGSASLSMTSKYRELIENWDQPPLLQSLPMDVDDQGWLFETKQNRSCRADERIVVSDSSSYGDSASWPCARQLPEADIYTLPFTALF